MKAFVAGATGATGQIIVRKLIQRGVPVRALVRDPVAARQQLPIEAELIQADLLDRKALSQAIDSCSLLLSATGARPSLDPTGPYKVDYLGSRNLVDAAKEMGVEHFVMVSSLCVSKLFHPLNLFWLVLYWKKQAEEYLQSSGLTYTIVRPGGLKNEDSEERHLVMAPADTLFEGSVSRLKVAETCMESLFHRDARNQIIEIISNEQAAEQKYKDLFAQMVGGAGS